MHHQGIAELAAALAAHGTGPGRSDRGIGVVPTAIPRRSAVASRSSGRARSPDGRTLPPSLTQPGSPPQILFDLPESTWRSFPRSTPGSTVYLMSLFRFGPVHALKVIWTPMKTFTATPDDITHDWYVVDADGIPLGRLATAVARSSAASTSRPSPRTWTGATSSSSSTRPRCAHRPQGDKRSTSSTPATWATSASRRSRDMLAKHPERVIEKAVFGMLPEDRAGRSSMRGKLRVYARRRAPARRAAAEAVLRYSDSSRRAHD